MGIGMEADAVRRRLHPEGVVSYVLLGSVACAPLLDGKASGDSLELVCGAIVEAVEMGATGVRLAGVTGRIEKLEELLRGVRKRFPSLWIEGLTPAQLLPLAGASGLRPWETIERLQGAGMDSFAGDGAAMNVQDWVGVHRASHGLGMRTAATMVFGAGAAETPEQRVEFLEAVRQLQEETGGFAAFVPMAADPPDGRELDGATAVERLKALAISRMFLDNIENVQSSRAGQGLKVLQTGLRFGANDVGPVDAGGANGGSEEDLRRVIRDAGFRPVERDPLYRAMFLG